MMRHCALASVVVFVVAHMTYVSKVVKLNTNIGFGIRYADDTWEKMSIVFETQLDPGELLIN